MFNGPLPTRVLDFTQYAVALAAKQSPEQTIGVSVVRG